MLDAILINPCLFERNVNNIWRSIDSSFPSLGLISIASYIREKGFTVKIIDVPVLGISVKFFEDYLKNNYGNEQPRYIGFTAVTPSVKNAYIMAKIAKKIFPEVKIVFGGSHSTILSEEVIRQDEIDIVVRGEGEITFTEILEGKDLASIDGIVYQKDDKIIFNHKRERIKNLDELPWPAYDLLDINKYYPGRGSYKRLPAMTMLTSRGCPGRCTFCNRTFGHRVTFRSAESLIDEIKILIKNYGIKQIMFYDDTFTTYKENVKKLCQLLIDQNIDVSWSCFSRVDYIDLELLKLMKKSGCHQIMYGIESGVQEVLDSINKNISLDLVREVVRLTKLADIDVRCSFMIGNPIETKETILKTLDFAIELNPDVAAFNITTPYPGTQMFKDAKKKDLITIHDWNDYDLSKSVMKLENINQEEVLKLYSYCNRKFFFRREYILMRLKRLLTRPSEIVLALDAFKAFFYSLFLKN